MTSISRYDDRKIWYTREELTDKFDKSFGLRKNLEDESEGSSQATYV